ncbi:putative chaperone protein HSP31 [Peziza echinospora]|nr:putative chaperone protein HSP31 [Peziza echinospora]
MSAQKKIVFILTSHDKLGESGKSTGFWLTEFSHPYKVLSPVAEIVVASPLGGAAPLDASSVEAAKEDEEAQTFRVAQADTYKNTVTIKSLLGKAAEFDAILVVGGHGPMYDLPIDEDSIALIEEFAAAGKVVSAVCHGPAALVNVKVDGKSILDGEPVTGLSNVEEEIVGAGPHLPFLLEDKLVERGSKYEKAGVPFGSHIAIGRGGKLITGQNPASATEIAYAIRDAIHA